MRLRFKKKVAQDISMKIGELLRQTYEQHEGGWWLFADGKPKRVLRDYEIEWHAARRHKPFVPDGISSDDPHWWDDPPE